MNEGLWYCIGKNYVWLDPSVRWARHRGDVGIFTEFVSGFEKFKAGPVTNELIYKYEDGFTHAGVVLKDLLVSLFVNPVPI
ncbi:hypothetical protein L3X38_024021 [Prunus dulcis]|uniref:Uncharacterized protein n=1 Tax=Prunus dulcis TaxID=3755 RepID=A0AAD4W0M1_PRUDU|nr:hypothetical protein L3X38_024021 [Prunus dulcis]